MNTSLKHLSPAHRDKLERAVGIIIRAVLPEKIVLFGGAHEVPGAGNLPGVNNISGVNNLTGVNNVPFVHDLLVITRQGDRRSDYELQDIIENRCREEAPVTVLVHDISYVNRRRIEGQYFFSLVVEEGILLYDSHRTPLAKAMAPDLEQVRRVAGRDYDRWSDQARAFYRSAEFNRNEKQWRIATFLLHQAAEHLYQAVLLAFTGYKPTTHNLDKLRRYTNRFSVELARVFPRDSEKEDELFRLLLSGYVDARYKEDFVVTENEVGALLHRIGRMLEIAARVCGNHFLSLEKMM